jgi:hypothetical protein
MFAIQALTTDLISDWPDLISSLISFGFTSALAWLASILASKPRQQIFHFLLIVFPIGVHPDQHVLHVLLVSFSIGLSFSGWHSFHPA